MLGLVQTIYNALKYFRNSKIYVYVILLCKCSAWLLIFYIAQSVYKKLHDCSSQKSKFVYTGMNVLQL